VATITKVVPTLLASHILEHSHSYLCDLGSGLEMSISFIKIMVTWYRVSASHFKLLGALVIPTIGDNLVTERPARVATQ
jgi:hypothetical protein